MARSGNVGNGYSHSYEIGPQDFVVYVSGQTPLRPDGTLPEGFAAQCREVWANVARALEPHNLKLKDIVKVTTFLSDRRYREENAAIRRELLDHSPALTVIIAGIYDESWLLEIEVVAASYRTASLFT